VHDLNGSYEQSWTGFWHHVLALSYTGFFTDNALTRQLTAGDWLGLWVAQLGWVSVGLGLLGLGWWFWRGPQRRFGLGLLVILLTNTLFALGYRVSDPEVFMLPAWLIFALFAGVGVAALRQIPGIPRPVGRALQALSLFTLLIGGGGRGQAIDRSQDWAIHDYAVALAKVDFPPASRVIGLEGQITALRYMQAAESLGEEATGIVANAPAQRVAVIAAAMQAGNPVYLTQEVDGIAQTYTFSGEGPLVRVWPRGQARVNTPDHPLALAMANGQLTLVGYDLLWLEEAGGDTLRVVLYWQPQTELDAVYKVSLRLLGDDDRPLLDRAAQPLTFDRFPLRQVAPTTTWLPNEVLRDVYDLPLGQNERSAAQTLQMILYDAATVHEAGATTISLK